MSAKEKEEIEDLLRSVVQSTKGGITLRNVQGDFRSVTGSTIRFDKFGYSSLEAMLRDMPHVVRLDRQGNEIMVHAVANEATSHLSELISKQKASKTRAIAKPRRPMGNQNWRPPSNFHPTRNHFQSRPPSRHSPKAPLLKSPVHHPYYANNRRYLHPISSNVPSPYPVRSQERLPVNQPDKNERVPPPAPQPASGFSMTQQTKRPVPPGKSSFELPPRFQNLPPLIPPRVPPAPTGHAHAESPVPLTPLALCSFSPDAPEFIPKFPNPSPAPPFNPSRVPAASVGSSSPPPVEPGLPWPNPRSNKELVDNYAFINGLTCVYRPCETKSKKKHRTMWLSQLILDGQKFVSYPVEMNTVEEANEEAAKRAVEKLNIDPNIISLPIVPACTESELNAVVEKIRQIVSENPQGIVHLHVQEQFKKRFRMRLPPGWLDQIQNVDFIRIDRADDTHYILFYEKSSRSTPEVPPVEINGSSGQHSPRGDGYGSDADGDLQSYLPDALPLPDTKDWEIYVTHAANTAYICFRFIIYADAFDEFSQMMEDYYSNKTDLQPVTTPKFGAPYCAFVEDTWHRVFVTSSDEDGMILCDFPDVGDSVWLEPSLIYELDRKFLELPFQAFRAELAGLSCFENDAKISEMLIQRVIGKALVAEPTEREESIVLVLYDTSTDDDVNLNKTLLEDIFAEITPPVLSQTGTLVEGFLGDILPSGDVRLSVEGRSSQLLDQLLENVADTLQVQRKETPISTVSFTDTYAVVYCDKWHRAIPASDNITAEKKVSMLLIDVGIQTDIALSDICKLEGETVSLSSFPALAVRCHLSGISSDKTSQWNADAKAKLMQLVPKGTRLLIKVASKTAENELPIVDLFKRLEPNMELVSINQTLAINFPSHQREVNAKPDGLLERKHSRPGSLQAPSPPPAISSSLPSPATSATSPTSSYSFVEANGPLVNERPSGSPLGVFPPNSIQDMNCHVPYFNNTSSVIQPGLSKVMEYQVPINPGSAGILLNNNPAFNFVPMQEALTAASPGAETSTETGINTQEHIPAVGQFFDVFILTVANPNSFICQSRKSYNALGELFDEMQQFYNNEENICEMHHCLIHPGVFLALKFRRDNSWYRVHVQTIVTEEPFSMLVYFVDYGGFEMAKLRDVQVLYKQFCKLPYQAISASLSGIKPANIDYSPTHCLVFKEMIEGKNLVSVVLEKVSKNQNGLKGTQLFLTLVDTSTSDDVYIHEELVKKGISKKL